MGKMPVLSTHSSSSPFKTSEYSKTQHLSCIHSPRSVCTTKAKQAKNFKGNQAVCLSQRYLASVKQVGLPCNHFEGFRSNSSKHLIAGKLARALNGVVGSHAAHAGQRPNSKSNTLSLHPVASPTALES